MLRWACSLVSAPLDLCLWACSHTRRAPKNNAEIAPIATPTAGAGPQVYPREVHKLYGIEQRPKMVACNADLASYQQWSPSGRFIAYTTTDPPCGSLPTSVVRMTITKRCPRAQEKIAEKHRSASSNLSCGSHAYSPDNNRYLIFSHQGGSVNISHNLPSCYEPWNSVSHDLSPI